MDFKPETLHAILFTLAALGGGLLIGGIAERILLGRMRKRHAGGTGEPWRIWRGLGVFTGLWIASRVVLEQSFLTDYWQQHAWQGWKIAGILIAMVYLGRLAGRLVQENTSEVAGALPAVSLLNYLARGVIYISGILIILQALEISITPMITALGVGGLAVALALQDTLSNLFAGMQIIASRKIQPGQFIRLESGQEGTVTDITWRNTTLLTTSNMLVIVPNKTLSGSIVTNTYLPDGDISVPVEGSVDYRSDLEKVEQVLIATAQQLQISHEGAVTEFEPLVRFHTFGASSIDFRVVLRARAYEWQFVLRHEMIKAIHRNFKEEGIEIPFPITTLQLDDSVLQVLRTEPKN